MSSPPPFELAETPLAHGTTLIEASAGTGKTFTISGLFLRLLLEAGLSVREILVVTYTEAATEELRDRIRRTLSSAAAAFRDVQSEDALLKKYLADPAGLPALAARLDRALGGFDEAPIFTIHGFCQRTLKDRAFESGALFDLELITDDSDLLQELADDFWRKQFNNASPVEAAVLLHGRLQPECFVPLLKEQNRHPQLRILSPTDGKSLDDLRAALDRKFSEARKLWQNERDTIAALMDDDGWAKAPYTKPEEIEQALDAAGRCFESGEPTPESWSAVKFFSRTEINGHTRQDGESPAHPFFIACEELAACGAAFVTGAQIAFLAFAKETLPGRKEQRKVQSFDDLLLRLHQALDGPARTELIREVRSKYQAALIDEFQDTDPVQYQIFRRLFQASVSREQPVASWLFLIGDPKQAIYGFRGADIFTYLEAAESVQHRYTLHRNWRSEAGLVRAVNAIFDFPSNPFVFEQIHFQPVVAAGKADDAPLTEDGQRLPPFHLWFMPREADGKPVANGNAEERLAANVAAETARLLNENTRLGDRRLGPQDIAVLVPKNRQARLMQEALRALNIPSVLHTEESVFLSQEARELARVLAALAHPGNESLVRAALTTDLLGVNGSELEALTRDDGAWQQHLELFRETHELWSALGFTAMFRHWLQKSAVRRRLLQHADGERRLTNLLHLAEALHQAAQERRLGANALVRWLQEQIADTDRASEEHQLRLERDDQAVRLVTIHKSKGLEYPVVFCPFSWRSVASPKRDKDRVFFHEQDGLSGISGQAPRSQFTLDLGSEEFEQHRQLALREQLAENLRLLYVALTRARHRCYFVWGAFKDAGFSAPSWLFHRPVAAADDLRALMDNHFKDLADAQLLDDLARVASGSNGPDGQPAIRVTRVPEGAPRSYVPAGDDTVALQPRVFTRDIPRHWRITSFSMLTVDAREEKPDYDGADSASPVELANDEPAASGIFAFPRGTTPGTCLHKIFEELDFAASPTDLTELVDDKLRAHGFSPGEFGPDVCDAVRRTLTVPLATEEPSLTLSRVPTVDRLNELEFYLPIQELSVALLKAGFGEPPGHPGFLDTLERLGFARSEGFLKGYIDLVFRAGERFYIVDWKSNWLGNHATDYGPQALARVMDRKFYSLQYHLYTVALHQYLQTRLPDYDYERHFGGVFYLFVRGIDPARPELGVFRDRPSARLIERLSERLVAELVGGAV